ncbi:unnamed protein product [Vitrella brassicaformis CCMP3155]|uniref:ubiquitinyl hydrolase 1 n=1 Tax=Vitrella brassicaformis (strain CCMP3155) TaxID=1169540 RepID=A0A0G4GV19_VITBC|nr:unnamed protein product [Vitrella brassicaformis CCMP3155]|eukprot:CEM34471.1 unnamed protein product [Vitrella brassicaformis CCMP3155]
MDGRGPFRLRNESGVICHFNSLIFSLYNCNPLRSFLLARRNVGEASATLQTLKEAFIDIETTLTVASSAGQGPPLLDMAPLLSHLQKPRGEFWGSDYDLDMQSEQDTAETLRALLQIIECEESTAGVSEETRFGAVFGCALLRKKVCQCGEGREAVGATERVVEVGVTDVMDLSKEWDLTEVIQATLLQDDKPEGQRPCSGCGGRITYKQQMYDAADVLALSVKRAQCHYTNWGTIDRQYPSPLRISAPMTLELPTVISPVPFELFAVQFHHPDRDDNGHEEVNGGHCTALAKCSDNKETWAIGDDAAAPKIMSRQEAAAHLSLPEVQRRISMVWYAKKKETENNGSSRSISVGPEAGDELFPEPRASVGSATVINPPFPSLLPLVTHSSRLHKKTHIGRRPQLWKPPKTPEKPSMWTRAGRALYATLLGVGKCVLKPPCTRQELNLPPGDTLFPAPRPRLGGPKVIQPLNDPGNYQSAVSYLEQRLVVPPLPVDDRQAWLLVMQWFIDRGSSKMGETRCMVVVAHGEKEIVGR